MKIATWNVNSLKARLEHVLKWLGEFQPDVVLLQELKGLEEIFPQMEIKSAGYETAVVGQKTYNGVAILSKHPIEVTQTSLPENKSDEQARYVEGVTNGVRVASIYLPNGNPVPGEKFDYKLEWMGRLLAHTKSLLKDESPLVLGGDYNVIPSLNDAYNPEKWKRDALFMPQSRNAFRSITNLGLTDALSSKGLSGHYTWWDYRAGSWPRDEGCRIDHLLLNPAAADMLVDAGIDKTPRGWEKPSDHTPAWCELEL
ncbi:MAG: exodeoxyribonuclease III [Rhodospirillaceae bacterium]|nr:exodeoxyribonuclease III [Rhodospirillaceae bacterium]